MGDYTLITANRNYSSWSLRPWVLMKALGIPFCDRIEPFAAVSNFAAFRSFSPTGMVPALIDGDRTIWDSLGITLYLAERHDGIWPAYGAARAFAQCAVTEMHGGFAALRNECPMNVGVRMQPVVCGGRLAQDVARLAELFAQGLDQFGGPYLAGPRFSAVDAFFAPVVFRIRTFGLDIGRGQRWADDMLLHPAMRQWEAEALVEEWREQGHEEEIRAAGIVTHDFRKG
ncbi:glutathione S-transferase family protein [Altererythrobacter aquiaggeris]|uniref:glutathione S-transferase family protein n=1 Tax=Aestuarierythrobacter aquiaggeris TaxID=1898396 RepID=UPI003015BDD5